MGMFIKSIFPLAICIGAFYLVLLEIAGYVRAKKQGKPMNDLIRRLYRRVFGAILIISISFMLFWGLSRMKPLTIDNWENYARYWGVVVAMLVMSVMLAVWDMLDGVKNIEKMVEKTSKEHLSEVRKKLTQCKLQEKRPNK